VLEGWEGLKADAIERLGDPGQVVQGWIPDRLEERGNVKFLASVEGLVSMRPETEL